MLDSKTDQEIRALPCWSGKVDIAPLTGGITNRNYRVTDLNGQRFVVRIGRDIPQHGVLRFHELAAARAAHAAGIAPEVVFASDGCLVSRFIDGRALAPADVRDARMLVRIIELLRRCHREVPRHFAGPALIFWVFQVNRNYLRLLRDRPADSLDLDLDALAQRNERLERAVGAVTIVFGHNDLLAGNLLDDGTQLWLIDWEYAGFNSPLFDLANLASNNELTPAAQHALLDGYGGAPADKRTRRSFSAMQCASLLRETLWGAVSRLTSTLDVDYARYTREYAGRFERSWRHFEAEHG